MSLISKDRLDYIRKTVAACRSLSGAMAEVGVYKGGSAKVIAKADPMKVLYAFDTFTGLPEKTALVDLHDIDDFNDTSFEEVSKSLEGISTISMHKGMFPKDTGSLIEDLQFSFVHLDVDQYQSNLDCLKFFYPRMVKGGVIVLDDYLWRACPGIKRSCYEFLADKPEHVEQTVQYQAKIVKL